MLNCTVDAAPSNHKALKSASVLNSRALARVVPVEPLDGGEKSSSSSPENVLGLVSYASDDDEDGELQSSSISHAGKNTVVQPSTSSKYTLTKGDVDEISNSEVRYDRNGGTENNLGMNLEQFKISKTNAAGSIDGRANLVHDYQYSSDVSKDAANSLKLENKDSQNSRIDTSPVEEDSRAFDDKVGKGSVTHDSHSKDVKMRTGKNDKYENRSFSSRDFARKGEKREEYNNKLEEKHLKREMTVAATKEKVREHGARTRETPMESERGRKPDHPDVLEERKDKDKYYRVSAKEESDRKKESKKAGDRSTHKQGSESSKHKRRRSSSVSSRGRVSKDSSGPHANDSYDEVSNDSKRYVVCMILLFSTVALVLSTDFMMVLQQVVLKET